MTFTAIFVLQIEQFCLYLPEALFNTIKMGFQIVKSMLFLFEINRRFYSKVMITLIITKFLKIYLPFGKNLYKVTFRNKITGIFLVNIKDHNFGMKTLINFK